GLPRSLALKRNYRYAGAAIARQLRARFRGKTLAASIAVILMLMGVGVIGGTYFLDSVKVSNELVFPATTTVRYADGTPMATLGEVTRYELAYDNMNDAVVKSIVA